MIPNIECLTLACDELSLSYSFLDTNKNCVAVGSAPFSYFINAGTPLNSEDTAILVRDKEFTYNTLKNIVKMPETKAYFDPLHTEWNSYKNFSSHTQIIEDILQSFTLPVMIKRNKGEKGIHVFESRTQQEVEKSITTIFDQKNKNYDYVALAQAYIPSTTEYRVIVLDGKIELVYEKNLDTAKAKHITDSEIVDKLQNFIDPIFKTIPLRWSGLDIISGTDDNLYLLELNTKPGFGYFLQNHDSKIVVEIYKKILGKLPTIRF